MKKIESTRSGGKEAKNTTLWDVDQVVMGECSFIFLFFSLAICTIDRIFVFVL